MTFVPRDKMDVEPAAQRHEDARPTQNTDSQAMEALRKLLEQQASAKQIAQAIAKHPRETDQMMAMVHQARGSHFAAEVARELKRLKHVSAFLVRGEFDDGTVDDDDGTVDSSRSPQPLQVDDGTVEEDDGTVDSPVRRPTLMADDGTVDVDDGTVVEDDGTVDSPVQLPVSAQVDDGTVDSPVRRPVAPVVAPQPPAHGTRRKKP
jgi:hypothetical protein